MAIASPIFNENKPPLLAEFPVSAIYNNDIVYGPIKEYTCILSIDVWNKLSDAKAKLLTFNTADGAAFTGVVDSNGNIIYNDGMMPIPILENNCFVLANVKENLEWHLVEGPEVYANSTTLEETIIVETTSETLSSFETQIEASVEASAKVSGLVTEASVTARLGTSIKSAISEQNTILLSEQKRSTVTREGGKGYANWLLYARYEFEFHDELCGGYLPLNKDQFALIKPSNNVIYTLKMIFRDDCPKSLMPAE